MRNVVERIRAEVAAGTTIPKPAAKAEFVVKGWGRRRGQPAIVYQIPNHRDPNAPYEKGITEAELKLASEQLDRLGEFTRAWFEQSLPACAKEGGCNFTTIGGLFELLGVAVHERGRYLRARGA